MADIAFVLDSSGSVGLDNWNKMLEFVNTLVKDIGVGMDRTRVAVIVYGSTAETMIKLKNDYYHNITQQISALRWQDSNTNTSGGIWKMMQEVFNGDEDNSGDRSLAPNIGIVVTDGKSTYDAHLTIPTANAAKHKGTIMVAVGVGDQVDENELNGIASNGSLVLRVDNFDDFGKITSNLKQTACDIPVDCRNNADIVFMLDSSGSMRDEGFLKVKEFVNDMVDTLNVAKGESMIGVMTFSDTAQLDIPLGRYQTRTEIRQAIDQIIYRRGKTNTAAALRLLREQGFPADKINPFHRKIAVILTDGNSDNFLETIKEAMLTRAAGITLLVIPATDWINMLEIKEIATDPDEANIFMVKNVDELQTISKALQRTLCDSMYSF